LIHFHLFVFLAVAFYLLECLVLVPTGGWLMIRRFKRFSLFQGPTFAFRNPWAQGFAYRFNPADPDLSQKKNLDVEEAQRRWDQYLQEVDRLFWLSRAMLGVVTSAILIYAFGLGFWLGWVLIIGAFFLLHFYLVILFRSAHRALYPDQKSARRKGILLCLFSPWQSARAMDLLGDQLFNGFHPFPVGKVLLEEADRNRYYRRWMLDLKYPAVSSQDSQDPPLMLAKNRESELKKLTQWLIRAGLNYQASLATPVPSQSTQKSFCPRCETAYNLEKGFCNDCGRDLVPF
jgi:hypothetical protein